MVSTIGLGAMMFGPYGNNDQADCVRMIHRALDAGVNLIDTADRYSRGISEEIVGRAIAGRRSDVVVATKFGLPMSDQLDERGASPHWIKRAVEASLRRLGTDYIDLYQLHRPDPRTPIEVTMAALTDLVHAGKVRHVGCSTLPAWQIVETAAIARRDGLIPFATEQAPYSVLFRDIERDVLVVTQRLGMGVLAWSPLASGLLSGRYAVDRDYETGSRGARTDVFGPHVARRFDREDPAVGQKLRIVEDFVQVAQEAGVAPAHAAVAFAVNHPGVTTALVGPRTHEQLQDVLAGAEVRLSADLLDAIDRLVPPGDHAPTADRRLVGSWMEPDARRRDVPSTR